LDALWVSWARIVPVSALTAAGQTMVHGRVGSLKDWEIDKAEGIVEKFIEQVDNRPINDSYESCATCSITSIS
jgi:hypothetical protein